MKLILNDKKLELIEINNHWDRFKTLKFSLKPLKEAILFSNRKFLSTYFFCQKVDVIMTDKDNTILYLYKNLKTEKFIHYKRKVFNTYILPNNSGKKINIGDKIKILNKNKEKD